LTFDLSSPILHELGLEAAIEWLAERILQKHGIPVEFKNDHHPKPLSTEVSILLYKAVGELLINIVKHAKARKSKVSVQREGRNIRITVDDGVGSCIPEAGRLGEIRGFGLFSIQERLRHFGGSLQIQSLPGHGTHMILVAPLKEEEK
jgi:signal transduction histidine kinase